MKFLMRIFNGTGIVLALSKRNLEVQAGRDVVIYFTLT